LINPAKAYNKAKITIDIGFLSMCTKINYPI
jgi:hypothetical protein